MGSERAIVRLHREYVLLELICMGIPVGQRAAASVFLVGPEHHPDRAARPKAQPVDHPESLPCRDCSAPIIHGSLTHIPGVDVTSQHHDFVRPLPSDHFGDHVPRR